MVAILCANSVRLTNPQKRFGIGLPYELLYGFNVVSIYELARAWRS